MRGGCGGERPPLLDEERGDEEEFPANSPAFDIGDDGGGDDVDAALLVDLAARVLPGGDGGGERSSMRRSEACEERYFE